MVPRIESGETDYSTYVKACLSDDRIKVQYQETYVLTVLNHKGEISIEKKFKNPGNHDMNPVTGTYHFGLYENKDGTGKPLQTIWIQYHEGSTKASSNKFINLDLHKTYYVYELDDQKKPITDSNVHVINGLEYLTTYKTTNAIQSNVAKNGDTVTVTNQSRTKILPSTGSMGTLIYRLLGATLVVASIICLSNINKNNRKENRRKK